MGEGLTIGRVWEDIGPHVAAFHAMAPEVEITLRQGMSPAIVDDLRQGELDLAFVGGRPSAWSRVRVLTTGSEPVGIACASGHPLAEGHSVDPRALAEERFVADPTDRASHESMRKFFARFGVAYRVAFRVVDVSTMLDVIAEGLAVALLPRSAVTAKAGVCWLPLAGASPSCTTALIAPHRPLGEAARAFLHAMRDPARTAAGPPTDAQGRVVRLWPEGTGATAQPWLAPRGGEASRVEDLERRLRHIAAEVRAAGVIDDAEGSPEYAEHPELAGLTSRQWEILDRLVRGERVRTIADELFLHQSTVRNHLAVLFRKFHVHSQAELLERLRRQV